MYQVAIARDFIARHRLIGGDWGAENHEHSHHYRAEVVLEGETLDRHGYLVDIEVLRANLDGVLDDFRDRLLNDLPAFRGLNPSLEHFSRIIWENLSERLTLKEVRLTVRLWENERDWAAFSDEE